jgi:hypothetical protein
MMTWTASSVSAMPVLTPSPLVYPATNEHSAALRVVGIVIWYRYLPDFSCNLCEMALAESMGLPPPMLIMVSMLESFWTISVASSSWATGACCLILVKVPA